MRCRCCDTNNAMAWAGDFYCRKCRSSIRDTIASYNLRVAKDLTIDDGEIESVDSGFDNEEET